MIMGNNMNGGQRPMNQGPQTGSAQGVMPLMPAVSQTKNGTLWSFQILLNPNDLAQYPVVSILNKQDQQPTI